VCQPRILAMRPICTSNMDLLDFNQLIRLNSPMLDARQLRYFIAVAEELHFARAADRLNVAQSAVSLQIKQLEEAFGARLLNRRKRAAVSLTEAGRLFLSEAVAAIRQLERAEQVGRLAARGELGRIEVGYVTSAAMNRILPNL